MPELSRDTEIVGFHEKLAIMLAIMDAMEKIEDGDADGGLDDLDKVVFYVSEMMMSYN